MAKGVRLRTIRAKALEIKKAGKDERPTKGIARSLRRNRNYRGSE